MTRQSLHRGELTEKIRSPRAAGRRRSDRAMGSSSTTDWLLLWATGVGNANLAMLAGIGVALRKVREHLIRWAARG